MTAARKTVRTNPTVREATLSENARIILERRYLRPGEEPRAMFRRVAENVALADLLYDPRIDREELFAGVLRHEIPGDSARNVAPTLLLHAGEREEVAAFRRMMDLVQETLQRDGAFELGDTDALERFGATADRIWRTDYEENFKVFIENLIRQASASENWRKTADAFEDVMASLDFLPNSPTLMNAGTDVQQLSACFVLPVPDDTRGIFQTLSDAALIHKSGGGTGFSFSRLRPKGDAVQTTSGVASGPLSFMRVFNASTEEIKQGGKRRGANMGILRVDHPDILEFIDCKRQDGQFVNFNISVAITDAFMQAVRDEKEYDLLNPKNNEVVGSLPARQVFDQLVTSAWQSGDPGIVFIDRIEAENPTPQVARIEATNPCGEQPLLPYESCNLGSINLARMVKNHRVDYEKLEKTVRLGVHFLDNVIDLNRYPSRRIEFMTKRNRKIGLGVMGFADLLVELEIPYHSAEACDLAENLMSFIRSKARRASEEIARVRGTFPNWKLSIFNGEDGREEIPLRNATLTTVAPTGTISSIAGCWGGIEPYFSLAWTRKVMDGTELTEMNGPLRDVLKRRGLLTDERVAHIARQGTLEDCDDVPAILKEVFVTAHEMKPSDHIRMQAAFQKYCDNAVSKTINLKGESTEDDVRECYMLAWDSGLKGITVFRDGCKAEQVYYRGLPGTKEKMAHTPEKVREVKRGTPEMADGQRIRKETGCGKLYVHVYRDADGKEIEIFADLGKGGGCPAAFTEGVGRMGSLALKHGAAIEEVRDELLEIKCPKEKGFGRYYVASCIDAIGRALHDYVQERGDVPREIPESAHDSHPSTSQGNGRPQAGACPECGGTLDYVEGCRGGRCRNPACSHFTCS